MADSLLAPMGLAVRVSPRGKTELNYVYNSLLAALALMLFEDLSRARSLQCPCGQLFVSSAYPAHYCSRRCRWRFEQRNFRSARTRKPWTKSLEP